MKTRVVIVDDEPLARAGVAIRLAEHRDYMVVGEGSSGAEALSLMRELNPDLVFLDIQMADMSGIDVLRIASAEKVPTVIFLTAFDEYAVAAFQVQALDYLLKPLDDERFALALRRAERRIALEGRSEFPHRVAALLQMYEEDSGKKSVKRFAVRARGQVSFIQVCDIDWIEGNGDYASLHVGTRTFLLRQSLHSLEERLSPVEFLRVHRSAIVQLDRIKDLRSLPNRDCELTLRNGTQLRSSRTYSTALWAALRGPEL